MRFRPQELAIVAGICVSVLLSGCSHSSESISDFAHSVPLQGKAFGGNQPISGSTIQIYAAGASGTGTAATALIAATLTTSDGSGVTNSNANPGNSNNSLPSGFFTIPAGAYTCPTSDTQVYITGTGGNPGLTSGTNNTALAIMASLGSCGSLSASTSININEVTTVGSIAALYPYATGYAAVASASTTKTALAEEFSIATEYMNFTTGFAPGPNLPSNYYGSSTEINTLADVLASCINTTGGSAPSGVSDGSLCGNLFAAAKPSAGTAPTDTIGAIIDILQNPTNNVGTIFNQQAAQPPFQPTLSGAPSDWTLPIVPLPQTPYTSPAPGSYAGTQSVTLISPTSGATVYYTTNGSTPTTSSSVYSSPITVSASQTINAIATYRNNTSAPGSSAFTITGTPSTPVISLASGTYSTRQVYTITSASPDAAIYVTTNGTTPTSASTLVTGSLQLQQSETVQAIAIASGVSSAVASATYTFTPVSQIITTLAGAGTTPLGDGLTATSGFIRPAGVAIDAAGNIYISDQNNQRIRKVTASTGIITTVAGNGTAGFTGDGGAATSAEISTPNGLAVDASGNLYIADGGNNRIRMVAAATGIITTVAGNATGTYAGDGGAATSASLHTPYGVAVDAAGNLYIADEANYRIRKVTASTGIIRTVAGTGTAGYVSAQDGAAATSAEINLPHGVAVDASGNIYIADYSNNRIRKVTASTGIIITVAGNGIAGSSGDGAAATSAGLRNPWAVTVDASGNLYISDYANYKIRKVTAATGFISTVAGTGSAGSGGDGGAATSATINHPEAAAVDGSGNIYIADFGSSRIRKVTASTAIISTVAGPGGIVSAGDGGPADSATLNEPNVAVDASGNVYIADYANYRVRKITAATGLISTVAGTGNSGSGGDGGAATSATLAPVGVALDASGNLYIVDFPGNRIRKVTVSTGIITTLTGGGSSPSTCSGSTNSIGDGCAATNASLSGPVGVAVDASGNVYIADNANNRIRKVTAATGIITTVAGNGTGGFTGDTGAATSAELLTPYGIAVDASGNLYISDTGNNRIRMVSASTGNITTLAGGGSSPSTCSGSTNSVGDGCAAANASLSSPYGIAFDASGNIYIPDYFHYRIRKVTASTGVISTVAGTGSLGFAGDGGPATSATVYQTSGVALDASGNLYIADTGNNRIRVVYH